MRILKLHHLAEAIHIGVWIEKFWQGDLPFTTVLINLKQQKAIIGNTMHNGIPPIIACIVHAPPLSILFCQINAVLVEMELSLTLASNNDKPSTLVLKLC